MNTGDTIRCIYARGYMLTEGKTYTVVRYESCTPDGAFTYPAYVYVKDDDGREVCCHADRFQVVGA